MKKNIMMLGVAALITLFVACDDKSCYCYERTSADHVQESVTYVHPDTPCSSLNTERRGCLESSERGTIDPNDIAK